MINRRSIIRFAFYLGDTIVSWTQKEKKPIFTYEGEYVAISLCVCYVIWLRSLAIRYVPTKRETNLYWQYVCYCTSKEPNESWKKQTYRFHFVQEHVKINRVELIHVKAQDQIIIIFTKLFELFIYLLSVSHFLVWWMERKLDGLVMTILNEKKILIWHIKRY